MISKEAFKHYTLGINLIDDEHWEILSLLNSLCHLDKTNAEIAINDIIILWNEHSNCEEVLLERIKFPYKEYHIKQHKEILNKLEMLKERISINDDYNCRFSASDLQKDICSHIDHQDLQVSTFINNLKRKGQ